MVKLVFWCDTTVRLLTALLIVISILAMGAVYFRGRAVIQMTAAVLGMVWGLRRLASPSTSPRPPLVRGGRFWATAPFRISTFRSGLAILTILLFIPLLPLPPRVLRILSPQTFAIAVEALPGWPARAPFDALRQPLDLQPPRVPATADLPGAGAWRPLSLVPHDTVTTLSLGAAYVVVAAVMAFYPWRNGGLAAVNAVLTCLVAIGIFEALYGVSQTATGASSPRLYWYECRSACMGSYLNRDHYAGLLEMIFPIALARAATWYGTLRLEAGALRHAPSVFRTRFYIDAFSTTIGRLIGTAAVALILLVAMAVSGSRSAFGASVAALIIMVRLRPKGQSPLLTKEGEGGGRVAGRRQTSPGPSLARRGTGWQRSPVLSGGIAAVAILWLTFPQLFGRFLQDDPGRPALAADTVKMALGFPLFGIGLGNFSAIFPLFRPLTVDVWQFGVSDAHNDYLQWIAEAGMPAALLTFALLAGFGRRVLRALRNAEDWTPVNLTRWGLATGVLAMLLHSLTDFNLHIPANALVFAVLIGSLVRLTGEQAGESDRQSNAQRPTSKVVNQLSSRRWILDLGLWTFLLCVFWAGLVWRQLTADTAYAAVYPNLRLTDLTAPREEPAPHEALRLVRRAADLVPGAPKFQAGLGMQLVARGVDPTTPSTELDRIFDDAILAYIRSLWAAPLQPHALVGLVGAVEPIYQPGPDFAGDALYDLVRRAAGLAPYDRGFQLTVARWYLARWDSFPTLSRPQAANRIATALDIAAQSSDLRQQVEAARGELATLKERG
ncbi:MAG: O-antigen ligase family protein [Candidatus Binatia bacterium]